jgi:transposase InsO family protein
VDSLDIVVATPPAVLPPGQARRLTARACERRAVLLLVGAGWPEPADLELTAVTLGWEGPDRTRAEARAAIFAWIHWYNRRRRHSTNGYLPPAE